ncbi:MAG: glycosyltransferase [Bacteroidales bacterium]|nr:glycosyltransferase [Bacteroidales bacterium]MDT8372816.1 glycosyltransferase [Bacteroidales bacterium]
MFVNWLYTLMNRTSYSKIIHLVSFNIPYPPDYGGVMDVFYKITALKEQGVGIILHSFSYGRGRSRTLERECLRVYYYRRDLNLFHLFRNDPFIVLSRSCRSLLENLLSDTNPIIFEGLHTTRFLNHPALEGRMKMVRTHNIEHLYYYNLAANEKNPFRRLFFCREAARLERYESVLSGASLLLTISPGDTEYFQSKYGKTLFVGPFHPGNGCVTTDGKGEFVLMHGDFSTAENNAGALYILREIAPKLKHKIVVAGKRPSEELNHAASSLSNVRLVPNPSVAKMNELIANAQVCLLNASQPSGMKLKLINALCSGRHVVASRAVVSGTSLGSLCSTVSSQDDWVTLTDRLMHEDFTPEMREERNRILAGVADNRSNAVKIIESVNHYGRRV